MNNRIGKLLLPIFYSKTASMSELRSLFSVFYPYKIMRAGLDNKHVLMFGVSPFFEEIDYDPKTRGYPTYKAVFQEGEYGKEFVRFEEIPYKNKRRSL